VALDKSVVCLRDGNIIQPTMVSLVTDADHRAGAVSVAAADAGARLPDVHVVHGPAVARTLTLLLDPAELGGPGRAQQR